MQRESVFMNQDWQVDYTFYGVGQGLFSAGCLTLLPAYSARKHFRWVYDCGTSSKQSHLDTALTGLECEFKNEPLYLDFVTISHFDHDHISGLVKLLSRFAVGDLLLPYMPLWQRLVIAFQAGRGNRSLLTRFLINPVDFIAGLPNASVRRILLVPAGGRAEERLLRDEAPSDGPPRQIAESYREGPLPVVVPTETRPDVQGTDNILDADNMRQAAPSGTAVEFMAPGAAIEVAGCWEFMPYNDADLTPLASVEFIARVSGLRKNLLVEAPASIKETTLSELKEVYANAFNSATQRENSNRISLFLYCGPIKPALAAARQQPIVLSRTKNGRCYYQSDTPYHGNLLYTGDGYLDTDARFIAMRSYLSSQRVERVSALQVMHHGSRHSWHAGLAQKIKPDFSIFSSNPEHKRLRHPHREVLFDFWSYRPLLANKYSDVRVSFAGGLMPGVLKRHYRKICN